MKNLNKSAMEEEIIPKRRNAVIDEDE